MSDYTKTIQTNGKSEKIAENISEIFIHRGYLVERKDRQCIALKQAVRPNRNNDPLMAVSEISIEIREREITVNADLSAFDMIFRILAIMLAVMGLVFFVLFGFILKDLWKNAALRFIVPLLPIAPWIILLPLIKRLSKNKCAKMLDTVIQNAIMIN